MALIPLGLLPRLVADDRTGTITGSNPAPSAAATAPADAVQQQLLELRRMIESQSVHIERQDRLIETLQRKLEESSIPEITSQPLSPGSPDKALPKPLPEAELDAQVAAVARNLDEKKENPKRMPFDVGYDKGFVIQPLDKDKTPFELRVNGRMQFRHTAVDRDVDSWTNNAGITRPIPPRNDFEIERGRLEFRTTCLDPRLHSYVNLNADTDVGHAVTFIDYWVNYEFNECFNLHFGKCRVPGSRDWLNGSARTRLVDRSIASNFFRPDRSVGIWAEGEPIEKVYYQAMVCNGFATTDLTPSQIDRNFCYSGSVWWDVLGDYGQGYSDLECHQELAIRVGNSFTYGSDRGQSPGEPTAEESFARLTDGTLLAETGALAPGVTVDHFDIYLYTVDLAGKYMGFSFNAEVFFRWLQSISGDGPLPVNDLFDRGFYTEMGYFLIAKKFEWNVRYSQVNGLYGNSSELATGFNWFINGTHNWKFTFDVTSLDSCPVNNSGANQRVGEDGTVFRSQLQVAF